MALLHFVAMLFRMHHTFSNEDFPISNFWPWRFIKLPVQPKQIVIRYTRQQNYGSNTLLNRGKGQHLCTLLERNTHWTSLTTEFWISCKVQSSDRQYWVWAAWIKQLLLTRSVKLGPFHTGRVHQQIRPLIKGSLHWIPVSRQMTDPCLLHWYRADMDTARCPLWKWTGFLFLSNCHPIWSPSICF